jgi:hypothetical protein
MSIPAKKESEFLAPETRFIVPTYTELSKVPLINTEQHTKQILSEAFGAFKDCKLKVKSDTSYETSTHDGRLYVNETELLTGKIEILRKMLSEPGIPSERKQAIQNMLVPLEVEKEVMKQEKQFQDDFVEWMLGYGKYIEYEKCWWLSDYQKGRIRTLWQNIKANLDILALRGGHDETVQEEINSLLQKLKEEGQSDKLIKGLPHLKTCAAVLSKTDYKMKRAMIEATLQKLMPKNQEECYLYYKYIVDNRSREPSFLEAGELRPYFYWRGLPVENIEELFQQASKSARLHPDIPAPPEVGAPDEEDEYFDAEEGEEEGEFFDAEEGEVEAEEEGEFFDATEEGTEAIEAAVKSAGLPIKAAAVPVPPPAAPAEEESGSSDSDSEEETREYDFRYSEDRVPPNVAPLAPTTVSPAYRAPSAPASAESVLSPQAPPSEGSNMSTPEQEAFMAQVDQEVNRQEAGLQTPDTTTRPMRRLRNLKNQLTGANRQLFKTPASPIAQIIEQESSGEEEEVLDRPTKDIPPLSDLAKTPEHEKKKVKAKRTPKTLIKKFIAAEQQPEIIAQTPVQTFKLNPAQTEAFAEAIVSRYYNTVDVTIKSPAQDSVKVAQLEDISNEIRAQIKILQGNMNGTDNEETKAILKNTIKQLQDLRKTLEE